MEKATTDANLQIAKEKKDREAAERAEMQYQGNFEQNFTLNHDFMTEDPKTEQSMLAPHRVKPYHFKGFSAEQTESVMNERALQMKEAEMLKKTKAEEEKLWAMQQEHLRRQQVLADRQMKKNQRAMAEGTRATQEQQKLEFKQRMADPYAEKVPAFTSK